MMHTTLNKIKDCKPCKDTWDKLLVRLGKTEPDDEPLPFSDILDFIGIWETVWCFRSAPEYSKEWRLFAIFCARQVQYLLTDKRSFEAISVAERFVHDQATPEELEAARSAAFGVGCWPKSDWAAVAAADTAIRKSWIAALELTVDVSWAESTTEERSRNRNKQIEYLRKMFVQT